jgi:hypothetical protein
LKLLDVTATRESHEDGTMDKYIVTDAHEHRVKLLDEQGSAVSQTRSNKNSSLAIIEAFKSLGKSRFSLGNP